MPALLRQRTTAHLPILDSRALSIFRGAVRPGVSAMNACFEIRYQSLFSAGRALSFPCDAEGHVQMDSLSNRARDNYLYARAVVGREYAYPSIRPTLAH
jgi:hypothetical protein